MSLVWVVADHHFGHENIIRYCDRPFDTVDRMDSALMKRHNEVVAKEDTTYFLGDLTLKTAERAGQMKRILERMNGRKILIFGNHDQWHWERYLDVGFQSCHTFLEFQNSTMQAMWGFHTTGPYGGIAMCHDPAWAQDRATLWVCGHTHNNGFGPDSHIATVTVERTEYRPVLLKDIAEGYRP